MLNVSGILPPTGGSVVACTKYLHSQDYRVVYEISDILVVSFSET